MNANPSRALAVLLTTAALALLTLLAPAVAWAADGVQVQPRNGSRIIVQPQALTLIAPKALRSAQFQVTDGCGRPVRLGAVVLDSERAGLPLPGQQAGVGSWSVRWQAVERSGQRLSGQWAFSIVDGFSCPGAGGAVIQIGGHHKSAVQVAEEVRSANANRAAAQENPALAAILAVLVGVAAAARAITLLLPRRHRWPAPADLLIVVAVQVAVFILVTAAHGPALWIRLALGVPTALLATTLAIRVAARAHRAVTRMVLAAATATAVTAALGAVWASGRSVLSVVSPVETFGDLGTLALSTAVVTAVLMAGGWYRTTPSPAGGPVTPQDLRPAIQPDDERSELIDQAGGLA